MSTLAASDIIIQFIESQATLIELCPNFYFNEEPEADPSGNSIRPPFCVFEIPKEDPSWTFDSGYMDMDEVKFAIYAYSDQQCYAIVLALQQAFDDALTNGNFVFCLRKDGAGKSDKIRDREGAIVVYREIVYEIHILRSLS